MKFITKHIDIDFYNRKITRVEAKQGDTGTRFLCVSCYNQSVKMAFDPTTDAAYVRVRKPDRKGVFNKSTIDADGNIIVELTDQILSVAGDADVEIVVLPIDTQIEELTIVDPTKVLSSMIFTLHITPKVLDDNTVKSSDEFNVLVELVALAQEAYDMIVSMENVINSIVVTIPTTGWVNSGEYKYVDITVKDINSTDYYDVNLYESTDIIEDFYNEHIMSVVTEDGYIRVITDGEIPSEEFKIVIYGKIDTEASDSPVWAAKVEKMENQVTGISTDVSELKYANNNIVENLKLDLEADNGYILTENGQIQVENQYSKIVTVDDVEENERYYIKSKLYGDSTLTDSYMIQLIDSDNNIVSCSIHNVSRPIEVNTTYQLVIPEGVSKVIVWGYYTTDDCPEIYKVNAVIKETAIPDSFLNGVKSQINVNKHNIENTTKELERKDSKINAMLDPDNERAVDPINFGWASGKAISSETGALEDNSEAFATENYIPLKSGEFIVKVSEGYSLGVIAYDANFDIVTGWNSGGNIAWVGNNGFLGLYGGDKVKYIRLFTTGKPAAPDMVDIIDYYNHDKSYIYVASEPTVFKKVHLANGYHIDTNTIDGDSNLHCLRILRDLLNKEGFNVIGIESGKDANGKAHEATTSLLVCDDTTTQLVDFTCMRYDDSKPGTVTIGISSRGDTPLPYFNMCFNDGTGAIPKWRVDPDSIPVRLTKDGLLVGKTNESVSWERDEDLDEYEVVNLLDIKNKVSECFESVNNLKVADYSLEEKQVGTWVDGSPIYQKTFECGSLESKYVPPEFTTQLPYFKKFENTGFFDYGTDYDYTSNLLRNKIASIDLFTDLATKTGLDVVDDFNVDDYIVYYFITQQTNHLRAYCYFTLVRKENFKDYRLCARKHHSAGSYFYLTRVDGGDITFGSKIGEGEISAFAVECYSTGFSGGDSYIYTQDYLFWNKSTLTSDGTTITCYTRDISNITDARGTNMLNFGTEDYRFSGSDYPKCVFAREKYMVTGVLDAGWCKSVTYEGYTPPNGTKKIPTNVNIDTLCDIGGVAVTEDKSEMIAIPRVDKDGKNVGAKVASNNIVLDIPTDLPEFTRSYLTLRYTKK